MEIIEKMKILHICPDYNRANLYYELITELQKNDRIENEVYVPMKSNRTIVIKQRNEKYPVIRSQIYSDFDRFFFCRKGKKIYNDIQEKIDFNNKDMIHAHTLFSSGYIAYKLNLKYNIKYIVSVRNTDINVFFKYRKNLTNIGIKILKNAEKIIFISKTYQKKLFDKYIPKKYVEELSKKSVVINNGMNEFWLKNRYINVSKRNKNIMKLLQVGEIDKNKNLETTIKAVKKMNKLGYMAKLNIAGTGKREKKLRKANKKYENIVFCGKLNKEELLKLYRDSDIFVLPSKHETFGLVYLEAMSQGLPVIYTKNQGFDQVFEDGVVGYPIKYNSINEMIEKILLIEKRYKDIAKSSYEKSILFDWKKIAKRYVKLLTDNEESNE